jgi:hypothetical protein
LSVDPLTQSYPFYTPYQFAGNSPILNIDLDGLEKKNTQENKKDDGGNASNLSLKEQWEQADPITKFLFYIGIFAEQVGRRETGEDNTRKNVEVGMQKMFEPIFMVQGHLELVRGASASTRKSFPKEPPVTLKPLTFEQVDAILANTNANKGFLNCLSCEAAAMENLEARKHIVSAVGDFKVNGKTFTDIGKDLMLYPNWLNERWDFRIWAFDNNVTKNRTRSITTIIKYFSELPADSHGYVSVQYKGSDVGHIFGVVNIEGKVHFYDTQVPYANQVKWYTMEEITKMNQNADHFIFGQKRK